MIEGLLKKTAVRIAAAALCAAAVQVVRADVPAYQAELAYKAENNGQAIQLMDESLSIGNRSPEVLALRAEVLEREAVRQGDLQAASKSLAAFKALKQQVPFSGKVRFQTAVAELRVLEIQNQITRDVWESTKKEVFDSLAAQPESSWLSYTAGTVLLMRESWLSKEERQKAYSFLTRASRSQPDYYLVPVLRYLTALQAGDSFLKSSIPDDYGAYKSASDFFRENAHWLSWRWAYDHMRNLRQQLYNERCESAETFAEKKLWRKALEQFDEAFWLDSVPGRARAGQSLCRFHLEGSAFQPVETSLERALEEGERFGRVPFLLRAPDAPYLGVYLKGILDFELQDYESAYRCMKDSPDDKKYRTHYMALSLIKLGRRNEAAVLLNESLEKKRVTVRDLLLLKELAPLKKEEIEKRLDADITKNLSVNSWGDKESRKARLRPGNKTGALVTLLPPRAKLVIAARLTGSEPRSRGALIVKLGDRVIGSAVVSSSSWSSFHIETDAQGGKYWLSIERVAASKGSNSDDFVEIGEAVIRSPVNEASGKV